LWKGCGCSILLRQSAQQLLAVCCERSQGDWPPKKKWQPGLGFIYRYGKGSKDPFRRTQKKINTSLFLVTTIFSQASRVTTAGLLTLLIDIGRNSLQTHRQSRLLHKYRLFDKSDDIAAIIPD
jgi:hypothetical protein